MVRIVVKARLPDEPLYFKTKYKMQFVTDHAKLEHLDYESSGHTGFASSDDLDEYVSKEEFDDSNLSNEDIDRILEN